MHSYIIWLLGFAWLAILVGAWLTWQLLYQNGRMLLRLEQVEEQLDELDFGRSDEPAGLRVAGEAVLELLDQKQESGKQSAEIGGNGDGRESRFGSRSLARSKIKRDGLKAGTPAPDFRLPRVDGRGELTLSDLRGRRVLLVFSSPSCAPCLELAPHIEIFHREHPELEVVMISKGEPKENRAKIKEQGLTFPVVLQQQWEISCRYAMFATPAAYLIDEHGVIMHDVAVGVDAVLNLPGLAVREDKDSEIARPLTRLRI